MTKGFIKKHLSQIKELLISNGLVDENWEAGEIDVVDGKWGYFKNDFFRISFLQKWVYKDDNVEPNCVNINGKNVYWSYDRRDESGEELLDVVSEAAIDSMYWNYFANIDDNSKEWGEIYHNMVKYITYKYGEKIKEYYHINCGN